MGGVVSSINTDYGDDRDIWLEYEVLDVIGEGEARPSRVV